MRKSMKEQIDLAANRKATIAILVISLTIMHVMKKYGKEVKD